MLVNFSILLRKMRSLFSRIYSHFSTIWCYGCAVWNPAISIGPGCTFGRGVLIRATDGGSITLGQGVCLADGVQIISQSGEIIVGDDVFVGVDSIIVCRDSVAIGRDSLIAEFVVIRDQDHCTDSRPIRLSGFNTSPVLIGADVWIGCKASILRGGSVGDRCVIGAHALVKSHIPDDMLAVGVPARVVKRVGAGQ